MTGAARRLPVAEGNERLFAVLGAIAIAFSSILVRLSHASPSTAAIFRCAYALPALGFLAWLEQRRYGPRPARDRGLAVAAGVFFAADLIMWHHSIGFNVLQSVNLFTFGPRIKWKMPFSDMPRFGPFSRHGRFTDPKELFGPSILPHIVPPFSDDPDMRLRRK